MPSNPDSDLHEGQDKVVFTGWLFQLQNDKLTCRAAEDKIKMIGFHWQSPGYAKRKGDAFAFVAA